jgi:hypothetical protein
MAKQQEPSKSPKPPGKASSIDSLVMRQLRKSVSRLRVFGGVQSLNCYCTQNGQEYDVSVTLVLDFDDEVEQVDTQSPPECWINPGQNEQVPLTVDPNDPHTYTGTKTGLSAPPTSVTCKFGFRTWPPMEETASCNC